MTGQGRGAALGGFGVGVMALATARACLAAGGPSIEGTVTILDRAGHPKASHEGVVVFLDELEHPPLLPQGQAHAVLRQREKRFIPELLPIVVGTTVDFPNDDAIQHNVFSLSRVRPFDLGIYEQGASRSVAFDETGLVKVYCNIHPEMVAYILVLPNPSFTITDRQGHFTIAEAPLGRAKVRTWYARSHHHPEVTVQVTTRGVQNVALQTIESVDLEVHEEAISLEHRNKWGQDYPTKY